MNKLNIKEANDHLKQLHRKVFELENQVQMHALHTQELERANAGLKKRMAELEQLRERDLAAKDRQISELSQKLGERESQIQRLLDTAEEQDQLVLKLESRARLFYEAVDNRASLAKILQVLEEIQEHRRREEEAMADRLQPQPVASCNGGKEEGCVATVFSGRGERETAVLNRRDEKAKEGHSAAVFNGGNVERAGERERHSDTHPERERTSSPERERTSSSGRLHSRGTWTQQIQSSVVKK